MISDQVTIRRAVVEDAQGVAECFYAAVHEKGQGFYSDEVMAAWAKPVTPERIEKFKNYITGKSEEVYVAVADKQIIGMMIIRLSDAKMGSLYVRRNKFGEIGKVLTDKAIIRMKQTGHSHIMTDASLPALAFYLRNHFVETGRGMYPGRNMEYVVMRREF